MTVWNWIQELREQIILPLKEICCLELGPGLHAALLKFRRCRPAAEILHVPNQQRGSDSSLGVYHFLCSVRASGLPGGARQCRNPRIWAAAVMGRTDLDAVVNIMHR